MKKSRQSQIVLLSVLGLAKISIATIGFASWVISGTTGATVENITAVAGEVVDNTLVAAITKTDGIGVRFDNVSTGATNFANGDSQVEDLNVDFTATVTGNLDKLSSVNFVFAPKEGFLALTGSGTNNTTADDYIVFPFSNSETKTITLTKTGSNYALSNHANGSSVGTSTSGSVLTLTCSFKFAWGAAFGNKNPGVSDTVGKADLVTRLNAFKAAFNTLKTNSNNIMTITVTPVATA